MVHCHPATATLPATSGPATAMLSLRPVAPGTAARAAGVNSWARYLGNRKIWIRKIWIRKYGSEMWIKCGFNVDSILIKLWIINIWIVKKVPISYQKKRMFPIKKMDISAYSYQKHPISYQKPRISYQKPRIYYQKTHICHQKTHICQQKTHSLAISGAPSTGGVW
jgi:hypothetical protein